MEPFSFFLEKTMFSRRTLPTVVFSMQGPFTESTVYEMIQRNHPNEFRGLNLALLVDIYLGRLVRYRILIQNGFEFSLPRCRSLQTE